MAHLRDEPAVGVMGDRKGELHGLERVAGGQETKGDCNLQARFQRRSRSEEKVCISENMQLKNVQLCIYSLLE